MQLLNMVSFRRRKKAAKETGNQQAKEEKRAKKKLEEATNKKVTPPQRKKKTKAASKATVVLRSSISKEYTPPLTTITESHDEENVHASETPVTERSLLQQLNLVTATDESMEVVVGSAASQTTRPALGDVAEESTLLLEQVRVFGNKATKESGTEVLLPSDKIANKHDDIRKALFPENSALKTVESEETDEEIQEAALAEDKDLQPVTGTRAMTPEEPPFDELKEYGGDEDPAILDIIAKPQTSTNAVVPTSSGSASNSMTDHQRALPSSLIEDDAPPPQSLFNSDVRDAKITKRLLAALNCNLDTTEDFKCGKMSTFYDTMCADVRGKRPFFSEEFTRDFLEVRILSTRLSLEEGLVPFLIPFVVQLLQDVVNDGIPLMFHYEAEPDGGPGAPPEWRGKSVTMFLRQGSYQASQIVHPRLEWPTPEQEWTTEKPCTVNLMDIQSINDSSEDDVRDDIEAETTELMDLCFFSITTKDGEVYMFESASPAERDWIVTGLKNVIVRLSYHLTIGDPAVSSELFGAEYEFGSGDLPTLKTPVQAMNEVAHAFLD